MKQLMTVCAVAVALITLSGCAKRCCETPCEPACKVEKMRAEYGCK